MKVPVLRNAKGVLSYLKKNGNVPDTVAVEHGGMGDMVDMEHLESLLEEVQNLRDSFGDKPSTLEKAQFDYDAALILHRGLTGLELEPSVLAVPGFWEWMSISKQPEIVNWRFPGYTSNRYLYGRNHFHWRLWMRVEICYDSLLENPYEIFEMSGRDNSLDDFWVQLLQRSFSGYTTISKGVIKSMFDTALNVREKVGNFRDFYRDFFTYLQHKQPVYCYAMLDDEQAETFIGSQLGSRVEV